MKRVVIYARYSSDKQTEQSIEGQIAVCEDFAKRNDYKIIDYYIDRAISGTTDNRPSFQKMIKDSSKKLFDYVLVYKLDRFSRNRYDSVVYKKELRKNDVKVVSACENITDTPESIILESLIEGYNEYFVAELKQKVNRGINESLKKCQTLGTKCPYGYDVENKKYVINKEEAKVVEEIFNKYAEGLSTNKIIAWLNNCKIKNKKNEDFKQSALIKMLKNEKYIGTFTYRKQKYENYLPKIIDEKLFNEVQEKMKMNKKLSNGKEENFLLTGKIVCDECGGSYIGTSGTSKTKRKYSYYKCINCIKDKRKCKNSPTFRKEGLEDLVVGLVREIISDDKQIENISFKVSNYSGDDSPELMKLNVLTKTLSDIKKQHTNIIEAIKQGIIAEGMKQELLDLEKNISALESEILILTKKIPKSLTAETIRNWFKFYANKELSEDNKRVLINALVNKIIVKKEHLEVVINLSNDSPKVFKYTEFTKCSNENTLVVHSISGKNITILITKYHIICSVELSNLDCLSKKI